MHVEAVLDRVRKTIRTHKLFTSTDKLLVAVSGGADSMMLLHLLHTEGYAVEAVHCNFQLRGEESNRDEHLVRDFCAQAGIVLKVYTFDTRSYAKQQGISLEMAARDLRYDAFRSHREATGCTCIVVAHHANDNVETVLYHLIRGTGLHGLTGMAYRNNDVVRPLLDITRRDVMTYVTAHELPYVVDSSNLVDDVARNKLRLNVIPSMEEILPSASHSIQEAIVRLCEAEIFYQRGVQATLSSLIQEEWKYGSTVLEQRMDTTLLCQQPGQETLLHEWLSPCGYNGEQLHAILSHLEGTTGKIYESKTHLLLRNRQWLVLQPKHTITAGEIKSSRTFCIPQGYKPPRSTTRFAFDADKLARVGETLHTRLWQESDSFVPFGMKGRKLISDFLTNRKYSAFDKQHTTLLCCGSEIIAVLGERIDNRFRIDDATQRVTEVVTS